MPGVESGDYVYVVCEVKEGPTSQVSLGKSLPSTDDTRHERALLKDVFPPSQVFEHKLEIPNFSQDRKV